jgi:hypothetical protein
MWLHELGHATTAWWTGFFAIPGPWKTLLADTRSPFVPLVLLVLLGAAGYSAHRAEHRAGVWVAAVLAVVALLCTLTMRVRTAQAVILFSGDGGAMVLGGALMATFYVPQGSRLHTTWLRWGFLVLGALAFMDAWRPWLAARRDPEAVPFGEIEGVGDSDPTRLVDEHGWSPEVLVRRYVVLGAVVLVALAFGHVAGVLAARRRVK